ncbi:TIM barrel protein [Nonomuraea typhae]|uniref:TIM barrel protein n=1 Tax=Nonomuraea typhae TaxID=2603600 RepID=UPI0012FB3DE8|nr:TIM barrel protein [Nonomuraea typhae]
MRVTRIANAPVSFGVFELSDGPAPLTADEMVRALADAGYTGIDLGPIGFLGVGEELTRRLSGAGFLLAGGWADLAYSDAAAFAAGLPALEATLEVFDAAPPYAEARLFVAAEGTFAPRPTLGCSGSPARFARPGGNAPGLAGDEWSGYAKRVQEAAQRCRAHGYEPVFHHHLGTFVETPAEVERLLELTDVDLCLDTGHLLLAGGDPVRALRDWRERIGHVHIKDGDPDILAAALEDGADLREIMGRGGFSALGRGVLDLPGVVAALDEIDYQGWIVVEQDTLPGRRPLADVIADQAANLAKLKELGL